MSEWRAGTRPGRVSLVRRLVGMLGVLAVLSVLGAAATALAHRPADPPPRQWLRAYGVEVAVPVSRWRLTDRAEAITYGAGATVHAPAVLDEGFCPSSDSSSRAFVGLLPPQPGQLSAAVNDRLGAWVSAISGTNIPVPLVRGPRADMEVPVAAGPCAPTTAHLTLVAETTPAGVVVLILVRDVGEPDDLSAAQAEEIVQSLRSRT